MKMTVSDHAVVRYCERVLGLDMEAVRGKILDICGPAAALGARAIVKDGHKFIISPGGDAVLTVHSNRHEGPKR